MTKQMKDIMGYLDYWKPKLFLQGWQITVEIKKEDKDDDRCTTAEVFPNYEYRSAHLCIYPHFFSNEHSDQKEIILHELLHIIIEPYKQMWQDMANDKIVTRDTEQRINETIVSWLTSIISEL